MGEGGRGRREDRGQPQHDECGIDVRGAEAPEGGQGQPRPTSCRLAAGVMAATMSRMKSSCVRNPLA